MVFNELFVIFNDFVHFSRNPMRIGSRLKSLLKYTSSWLISKTGLYLKPQINISGIKLKGFTYPSVVSLYREIFFRGTYRFQCSKKNPLILDLGANIGAATIYFKQHYPDSEIHSFEPDPKIYEMLKLNVKNNRLKKVTCYNQAVADKSGQIPFYLENSEGSLVGTTIQKKSLGSRKITVDSISMSSFIKAKLAGRRIDFIKMDVEGSEYKIIEDLCRSKLINQVDKFIIEYHHKLNDTPSKLGPFLKNLEDAGFEYQINTFITPISSEEKVQDILIYAYKR